MGQRFDVVIAGGGAMGSAAAYWLTRLAPGLRVLVAEPDPSYARAASALSAASIRAQFTNPVNVAMSRFGLTMIRDLPAALGHAEGVADLGLRENGYLFLAASPEAAATMREVAAMQRGLGAATELVDPAALAARFPWLATGDVLLGSFGAKGEGWFDNMGLVQGFRAAARAQGAAYVRDRVAGVTVAGGRVEAVTLARGGPTGCGALVNAAGTRLAEVMAMAGLDLPVEPRKRVVFVVDAPAARHPGAPLIVDPQGIWLRPEGSHWLAATTPVPDGPCGADDFEPDATDFTEDLWPKLYARVPGFEAARVLRFWVGHYDYNRLDQNAIIGPDPRLANLHVIGGFSGHGLQQAPAAGRGLAERLLTGHFQSLDLSDLGVERILAGRPFLERAVV